jgi:hypothetical protein
MVTAPAPYSLARTVGEYRRRAIALGSRVRWAPPLVANRLALPARPAPRLAADWTEAGISYVVCPVGGRTC